MSKFTKLLLVLVLVLCLGICAVSCNMGDEGETPDPVCTHEDKDNNHLCDKCQMATSVCADVVVDHKCDVCGDKLTDCVNNDGDHKCDRCNAVLTACVDSDKDHYCEICNEPVNECGVDETPDHFCDYCGALLGMCNDRDKDHDCDYCGDEMGNHEDSDDEDHRCDYCMGSFCTDGDDADHNCDECDGNLCYDSDKNCECDACKANLCYDLDDEGHDCEACGRVMCKDGSDPNHDCDVCHASLCIDGDDADHDCDVCGANLCFDSDNDCLCNVCNASTCKDGGDRGHDCDVCGKNLCVNTDEDDHICDACLESMCRDADGDYVCDTCLGMMAMYVINVEGNNCSVNGAKAVSIFSSEEFSKFEGAYPSYTANDYVIDFWCAYSSDNTVVEYIENGDGFKPTAPGVYYVCPIFIANKYSGVVSTDGNVSINISDYYESVLGTGNEVEKDAVSDDVITPAWADVSLSDKLNVVSSSKTTVLGSNKNTQLYIKPEPANAANTVLVLAISANGASKYGNTVIEIGIDSDKLGENYEISLDYYLDHSYCGSAGAGTFIAVKDGETNATYNLLEIEHKKQSMPPKDNPATPTEAAFVLKSVDAKGSNGSSASLNSDTWYTFKIVISNNKVNTYYSLRGSDEYTLLDSKDFSSLDISAKNLVSMALLTSYYNNHTLSYIDSIYFGKPHACLDQDDDHLCDLCEAKQCYDRADDDHLCDRCDEPLCYEGEIPDHYCDECGALVSNCLDDVIDHCCDICGEWKFGTDEHYDSYDDDHLCDYCSYVFCTDEDLDHRCDECFDIFTDHYDGNEDHYCDFTGCNERFTSCVDADYNHKCDYLNCSGNVGEHKDGSDEGHDCDHCNQSMCEDTNNDHLCDSCKATLSDHIDENKNHMCDMKGCLKIISECEDKDLNHECDYEACNEMLGRHEDKLNDNDHLCDYGCQETVSECFDTNNDYVCEECGAPLCYDSNRDHYCDIPAHEGEKISECADNDNDHNCDVCKTVLSECVKPENSHYCTLCGIMCSTCIDEDTDMICDICNKMSFEYDITSGVHLATGSAVLQESFKIGETYSPVTKSGFWGNIVSVTKTFEGGRAEVSNVLKLVCNDGSAKNASLTTLGGSVYFTPTKQSDDGGNIHIIEFDFNWSQSAKSGWRNPFTFMAWDKDGKALGEVANGNDKDNQYCVNALNNGGAFTEGTVVNNAYQFGISGTQEEKSGGSFNLLNSSTWYRIRFIWDQSTGKVNFSASVDGGETWFKICSEQTKKAYTDADYLTISFTKPYGHGGIMYFDDITYNVVSTMPELPTNNGIS